MHLERHSQRIQPFAKKKKNPIIFLKFAERKGGKLIVARM